MELSLPVPRGRQKQNDNTVMMSRVEEEGEVVVHASDIQLFDERTIVHVEWLGELNRFTKNRVLSAAAFMRREPLFLEAWRKELYKWLPVSSDWHQDYLEEKVDIDQYRREGWQTLVKKGRITPCKWYYCCPIRMYTEQGKLERYWTENYCLVGNKDCTRFQMEENDEYHPNNMLPNGEIREDLR